MVKWIGALDHQAMALVSSLTCAHYLTTIIIIIHAHTLSVVAGISTSSAANAVIALKVVPIMVCGLYFRTHIRARTYVIANAHTSVPTITKSQTYRSRKRHERFPFYLLVHVHASRCLFVFYSVYVRSTSTACRLVHRSCMYIQGSSLAKGL